MVGVGQLDACTNHQFTVQKMLAQGVLREELGHAHTPQFVKAISIVHNTTDFAGSGFFAVQREDCLTDERDQPFIGEIPASRRCVISAAVCTSATPILMVFATSKFADVMEKTCKQCGGWKHPFCFSKVVRVTAYPCAVNSQTGKLSRA